jgi:hypothetical protein
MNATPNLTYARGVKVWQGKGKGHVRYIHHSTCKSVRGAPLWNYATGKTPAQLVDQNLILATCCLPPPHSPTQPIPEPWTLILLAIHQLVPPNATPDQWARSSDVADQIATFVPDHLPADQLSRYSISYVAKIIGTKLIPGGLVSRHQTVRDQLRWQLTDTGRARARARARDRTPPADTHTP